MLLFVVADFVGQDVDLRCTRMTAINLALRNYYGHVVCGNSLGNTASLIYETGRVQVWGNAIRKVNRVPLPDREPEELDVPPPGQPGPPTSTGQAPQNHDSAKTVSQLRLF